MNKPDPNTCDNDADLFCPACGRSDQLDVCATVKVRLTPNGADAELIENNSYEWHDESSCSCVACGFDGTVGEFDSENWPKPDPALAAANCAKLPAKAFIKNDGVHSGPHGVPPVIAVERGETGYYPIYTNLTADELNEAEGVTKPQARAMYNGSLFGWEAPAADPDNPINQKADD